jgi:hypothetical protein
MRTIRYESVSYSALQLNISGQITPNSSGNEEKKK